MTDNVQTAVGEPRIVVHLAELMARHRITNEALAEAVGVSPNRISLLKNGGAILVRLETLAKICRELKCTPGDLLTYEE